MSTSDLGGSVTQPQSPQTIPNLSTLVWRSLTAFGALHLALAAGIAAATAVIVGALVVGDSMRGSLQTIVLQRLGHLESAMLSQRFFNPEMLSTATEGIGPTERAILPMIVLPSSAVELKRESGLQRAASVQALGVTDEFWSKISSSAALGSVKLGADEVALNATLAAELNAQVGDEVTLRLPKGSGVPADSPLGRRDDTSASLPRQRVAAILPDKTAADLDFRAGQQPTRNVFVPLAALQDALEQLDKVNAAIVVSATADQPSSLSWATASPLDAAQMVCDQMNARITPKLSDYGLKLTRHTRKFPDTSIGESFEDETKTDNQPQTIFDYYQITSDQLIIDNLSQETLFRELSQPDLDLKPKRILSYLVNEITKLNTLRESKPSVTYSIASGLESWEYTVGFGHGRDVMWDQRPSSCGVNSWLAERLNVQPGDTIRIKFFKPETMEGREIETSFDLLISAVVPTTAPSKGYVRNRPAIFKRAPTLANDPDLTPIVPGITDQDSISNWDLPFKLTRDIPKEDDDYWRDYRLTPKLFMRFSQAERLFGSRFGNVTSIRVEAADAEAAGLDEEKLRDRAASALLHAKAGLGLQLMPIRALQLQAASGTTPFDGLFLALSFFVIVAALMLVALLFRLSIEQRANQWGLLMATGFEVGRVRSLLLRESFVVVLFGILLGIGLGLGYARLMIAGLESWWVGAVSGSFLSFHITARSLILGALIGGGASLATILWSLRRLKRSTPLDLLRGRWDTARATGDANSKVALAIAGFLAFGAVGLLALGFTQNGMAQAGSFFGCGMCLLASALAATVHSLRARATSFPAGRTPYRAGLWSMAWSALTRNMWRSVLTIGLLAVASFLIASMSLFQIAPTLQGSGGFELIAESSLPIYRDLGSTRVREETLSAKDFDALRTVSVLAFRQRLGEDASCNNLFKVGQPTVLGVPDSLSQHQSGLPESQRFQWAAAEPAYETPWQALGQVAAGTENDPIPVVLDMNTAAWSLHQGASLNAITKIQFDDRVIYFRTVGLLSNSIMQGKLLVSDYNFSRLFPEISGYQFFLVHDEEKSPQTISAAMENGWSDQGMDVTSAEETLTKLLAVQNTYISAFQAIGALGLLLGTVGLAVVQVRSVLERRRELALMQAVGFSRPRLARLLLTEASLLLVGGIAIGIIAATIAILPYMLTGNSNVSIVEPLIMLAIILAVGGLASLIAVVTALRQPILSNLH